MPTKKTDGMKKSLISTGIVGLDEALGGGMVKNHSILLCGPPGAGKTTLAFQLLHHGAKNLDEPGAFISFDEEKEKLLANIDSFGLDLGPLENENLIHIQKVGALEIQQFASQESILVIEIIRALKAKRVVIDSLTTYELMFKHDYERMLYIRRLIEEVINQDCTFIATSESTPGKITRFQIAEFIFDTVIYLDIDPSSNTNRTIRIIKNRGCKHRFAKSPMSITPRGIEVYPPK
ncbi:MAG: ATPase domain-containing protein [Candidatus Micrarchaeota archaeon]